MRSCRRTKTSSFAAEAKENQGGADAVTLSDIDQFLFENFRSLYQTEYEEQISTKRNDVVKTAAFLFESPRLLGSPPPENLCSSARFFVASGSSSSLIVDEASSSSTTSAANDNTSSSSASEETSDSAAAAAPDDFIALLTYSPSPYDDFRRSMQEMVDARMEHNGRVDWEFLEELLFCYLDLNNKKSYRFILRAFVDLIVVLRENSGRIPASRPPLSGGARRKQLS
ncbi:hypothetical protein DH2020_016393 [Rehmannia glutinosa]|uniref:Transcription repressor n=1 Tax=Rehmannia glutinosa TaxID=99300 RepID=A0ABR0WMV2_REHGL